MSTELLTPPAAGEAATLPRLIVTRDEAIQSIKRQLDKGFLIRALKIRSQNDLESARQQKFEWTQNTLFVLGRIFETDAAAEEFNRWVGKILPEFADPAEFVKPLQDEMDQRLRKLLAILKHVESEADVVPRKVAEMTVTKAKPEELIEQPRTEAAPARVPSPPPMPAAPSPRAAVATRTAALIAHTRNEVVEDAISSLVSRLGFEPVLLCEQAEGAKLIHRLEQNPHIAFVMVLAGPEDAAAARQGNESIPGRSDFELGYCAGKLGYARVCVLHGGAPGVFHDRHGIFYIPVDSAEGWQLQLARQLRRAGIEVDLNKLC